MRKERLGGVPSPPLIGSCTEVFSPILGEKELDQRLYEALGLWPTIGMELKSLDWMKSCLRIRMQVCRRRAKVIAAREMR